MNFDPSSRHAGPGALLSIAAFVLLFGLCGDGKRYSAHITSLKACGGQDRTRGATHVEMRAKVAGDVAILGNTWRRPKATKLRSPIVRIHHEDKIVLRGPKVVCHDVITQTSVMLSGWEDWGKRSNCLEESGA